MALVGIGVGRHNSKIVDEEINFAEEGGFYIVIPNEDLGRQDTFTVSYDYYKSSNPHLVVMYSRSDNLSLGIFYQYKMINQRINPPIGYEPPPPQRIINLHQIGPIINFWKPLKIISLSASFSGTYNFGTLSRIPNIYNKINDIDDPIVREVIEKYHESLSLSGFGLSTVLGLNYFLDNGLFARLGLRYDLSQMNINDDIFEYTSSTRFHDFYIEIGIGFSTYLVD